MSAVLKKASTMRAVRQGFGDASGVNATPQLQTALTLCGTEFIHLVTAAANAQNDSQADNDSQTIRRMGAGHVAQALKDLDLDNYSVLTVQSTEGKATKKRKLTSTNSNTAKKSKKRKVPKLKKGKLSATEEANLIKEQEKMFEAASLRTSNSQLQTE